MRRKSNLRIWARRLLADAEGTVILDTETTGFGRGDEVVQVGVLGMDGSVLFDSLVRPVKAQVHPKALAVHGIGEDVLVEERPLAEMADELAEVLRDKRVVAYNASFDRRLLRQSATVGECEGLLAVLRPLIWVDAMKVYARGGRWMKLGVACKREGVQVVAAHDAAGDARLLLGLLRKLAGGGQYLRDGGGA